MLYDSELRSLRDEMKPLLDKLGRGNRLSFEERKRLDDANTRIREIEDACRASAEGARGMYSGLEGQSTSATLKGEPNEPLPPGVSMRQWVEAAAANGVSIPSGTDGRMLKVSVRDKEFVNDYYGGIMRLSNTRFSRAAVDETRALSEGTAGSSVNPISWSADVIDFLYANSILGKVGVTRVPMAAQQVVVPQLTGVPSPSWIAESGSISLDAGPAFSKLLLDASGGFKDITLLSFELMQDAYVSGGLGDYIAQQVAIRMGLAVDSAALYGIASNAGNPGFSNESGVVLRKYAGHTGTTGQAPADTAELSTMIEIVRAANAEPTAFVTSPQLVGTLNRIKPASGDFPNYWQAPADATDLWRNAVYSTLIPVTETDPATGTLPAQTAGTMTSLYLADWRRFYLGVRLDIETRVLTERYADTGNAGIFAFGRYSTRLSHPEAAVRSYGALTS